MMIDPSKPIEIAYLYNASDSKDVSTFKLLYNQLVGLRRKDLINEWDDSQPGTKVQEQTKRKLEQAHIIILLISSSFNAEDRYSGPEMVAHIRKCFKEGAHIWPIIIGPVYLSSFDEYETFFGKEGKSVQSSSSQDETCRQIAQKIGGQIAHMLSREWGRTGDKYYRQMYLPNALSAALSAYEHSLNYIPDHPPALLGKGRILQKQGKLEEATRYFKALVSPNLQISKKEKEVILSENQQSSVEYACYEGYALLELKNFIDAHIAFQKVYQQITLPMDDIQRNICAEAYFGEGDAYRMLGHQVADSKAYYNMALDAYFKATELVSDNLTYLARIGQVYLELGNCLQSNHLYERALDTYKQITQRRPDYVPAYVGKGNALYCLHRPEEALVAYDFALSIDPYEMHAYGGKGYVLLELGDPNGALSAFESALSLEMNESGYLYGKGLAQTSLGHYQEAVSAYSKAKECGFTSISLVVYRASALLELGDAERINGKRVQADVYYKDAFDSYNYALQQGWREPESIHHGLGRIFFAYNNWNSAFRHYKTAIELVPSKADAYLGIGKTLVELGNTEEAFAFFEKASLYCHHVKSTITSADIEIAYGDAYSRMAGEPDTENYYIYQEKARASYERAVHANSHMMAYIGLGKAYAALHYNKEAIDALNQALNLNSQFAECYFIKGKCYYELGQFSEAYSLYESAIIFGWDTIAVRIAQGDALLSMKSYIKAIKAFDDVIEQVEEEVAYAYCGKGIALHALGRNEEALLSFEEANKRDRLTCLQPQCRRVLQDISSSLEEMLHENPCDASVHKYKGNILLLLRESARDVVEAYTRAIEYGDRSADIYYRRGEVYNMLYDSFSSLKDYSKALKDYKKVLELDLNHSQAQQRKKTIESIMVQRGFTDRIAFWLMTSFR